MRKVSEGKIAILMVFALIAFVIGSAVGIMTSMGEHEVVNDTNTSHVENVTVEMTSNLSEVNDTVYDERLDAVDYNDPSTLQEEALQEEALQEEAWQEEEYMY